MAYFDFLNEPGVKPDSSDRYWYRHHYAWDHSKKLFDEGCSVDVKKGRVVHKLAQEHAQSGYTFEFEDEPGKVYHCNYTWAFARVTTRNWLLVRAADFLRFVSEKAMALRSPIAFKLDSLKRISKDQE